jgi:ubiquinone/menaquinone biosynthesis C-methylase UbiE
MDDPSRTSEGAPPASRGTRLRRIRANRLVAGLLWRSQPLLLRPLRAVNAALRALNSASHHFQYKVEGFLRPSAEWFDHELDAQWQWPAQGRFTFLERGVLSSLSIRPGGRLLELCCGDGFNAGRFYSSRAGQVLAVDHNPEALAQARRRHARPNVEFRKADIRSELPTGPFDNVIWDSAIHHFSIAEAAVVLASVHRVLADDGVLSGYTVIEPGESYAYTRLRFTDAVGLAELLAGEFAHVSVLETSDPLRRNLYFFASDLRAALPFAEGIHAAPEQPRERRAASSTPAGS